VKYAEASRVDFLLTGPDRAPCWLEVKNVHFSRTPGLAEFPDCVAARSTRHLGDLEAMVAQGDRAVALFVVQRMDCDRFEPAADCDPAFAKALERVVANGVELYVYGCDMGVTGITIASRIGRNGKFAQH
jgi:sugar fermentation stimulation protein A